MSSALAPDVEAQISADEALARSLQAEQQRVDSSTPLISAFFGGMRSNSGAMNEMGDARSVGTGREENRARIGQLDNRGVIQVQGGTGGVGGGAEDPGARRNVRINVMDDGVRGMNASRFGLMLLMLVNVPLIVAGVFVLSLHWRDSSECGTRHTSRWRWWALVSVVRMALITPVVAVRWKLEGQRESERNAAVDQLSNNMRNSLDIVGLVWFVIGNMWLLQISDCNPSSSPVYQLCLVYIIITYIHICLPCILLMLLVPVICFCLPCVIRVLSMLQGSQRRKGARQDEIDKLPILKYSDMEHAEDESCAICLADYADLDELRQLPCSHTFHKPAIVASARHLPVALWLFTIKDTERLRHHLWCVDSWLGVNASCPSCRARCFDQSNDEGEEKSGEHEAQSSQELA